MEVTVTVAVIVVVPFWSTLIFHGSRMGKGKGVVASFRLAPENIESWSFLLVGALESRGCILLLVGEK
jgi:hypothetical protein